MKKIIVSIFLLCSVKLLIGQNVYEIFIASFAESRSVTKVEFELYKGNEKLIEQVSNDGSFQFIIPEGDGRYKLKAKKESFIPKIIHFNSMEYPFMNEYEIQEIDIEFHPSISPEDEMEIGELKWSSLGHVFNVIRVDSANEYVKINYAMSEKSLGQIYAASIENADEYFSLGLYENSMRHYEVALIAKPNDDYSKKKIMEIKNLQLTEKKATVNIDKETIDKINRGEISEIPASKETEGLIFSVQLGAFSKKVDASLFPKVPDFKMIAYDDYTRVFSGEFSDINEALKRKNDMIKAGHKDAWIVIMKGNQRIGF